MARRKLIAGNWKMFKTTGEAVAFVEALSQRLKAQPTQAEVMVCPPFTALAKTLEAVQQSDCALRVAAQTMESRENGAYTGEIAPGMLIDLGVDAVVIGHSERRQYYNETDATVNAKTLAALKHNLTPIVCIGELLSEREAGATDAVVTRQVEAAVQGIEPSDYPRLVFAYEPVWAIGTGKVCDAPEADRVCRLVRQILARTGNPQVADLVRILYGGSMKPDNSAELLAKPDIDGGLIGGASLDPASFDAIIQSAPTVAHVG